MNVKRTLAEGVWPVMLTPFREDNELDLEGLKRLTDLYLASGVKGLFANCLSSEMYQLTSKERLTLTKAVTAHCKGQVPVVATGSFSTDTSVNIDFIKQIYDTGVAAVILITGILADPEEPESVLEDKIGAILAGTGDIPLGLYECPVPYKRLVSPQLMQKLAATGRFVYHKDTSCDSVSIRKKLEAIRNTNFGFYNADTPTALDSLEAGARGISPISANFYPEFFPFLFDWFKKDGRGENLENFHANLMVMDRIVHSFYPYSAKLFLQKRGLKISTQTRLPWEPVVRADRLRLEALHSMFLETARKYGIELKL
jgi:4-hydroxy-tetrahydrodipicolinate synthase